MAREVVGPAAVLSFRRHAESLPPCHSRALPFEDELAVDVAETVDLPDLRRRRRGTLTSPNADRTPSNIDPNARSNIPQQKFIAAGSAPGFRSVADSFFPIATSGPRQKAACWTSRSSVQLRRYADAVLAFGRGRIGFKPISMVTGATLALFYAQYFALFTIFGGFARRNDLCRCGS